MVYFWLLNNCFVFSTIEFQFEIRASISRSWLHWHERRDLWTVKWNSEINEASKRVCAASISALQIIVDSTSPTFDMRLLSNFVVIFAYKHLTIGGNLPICSASLRKMATEVEKAQTAVPKDDTIFGKILRKEIPCNFIYEDSQVNYDVTHKIVFFFVVLHSKFDLPASLERFAFWLVIESIMYYFMRDIAYHNIKSMAKMYLYYYNL